MRCEWEGRTENKRGRRKRKREKGRGKERGNRKPGRVMGSFGASGVSVVIF